MMLRVAAALFLAFASLSLSLPSPALAAEPETEPEAAWQFTDIEGRSHTPFAEESTRAVALIFISTDCPVANSYQPLLQRLAKAHRKDSVRFFLIHPNRKLTVEEARKHAKEYQIKSPVVIDRDLSISRRVAATVTPEAVVLIRDQQKPFYQGRIDNLYAGYGKKRRVATSHELADALDAAIAGRSVQTPKTKPVGCFIAYPKEK